MPCHLIVDADDTLWENNIYFEQAFSEFCELLSHSSLSALEVRDVLDEIELISSQTHGYGSLNFGRNLQQCYGRLCERQVSPEDLGAVIACAERILRQPVELIQGVEPTLAYLAARHELTLFTKGNREEQQRKIDESGLGKYFQHTAIVKEKNVGSYLELVASRQLQAPLTWMVGNSPKSDINPALDAGLNAVFVPHDRTWHLERCDLRSGPGKLLELASFSELQLYF